MRIPTWYNLSSNNKMYLLSAMILDSLQVAAISLYAMTASGIGALFGDVPDEKLVTQVEVVETGIRENSGIEQVAGEIMSVDDSGILYKGDQVVLEIDADLEGIAYCNENYYLIKERADEIAIYNKDFHPMGSIDYAKKIPRAEDMKNAEIEGIACASNGGIYLSGVGEMIWQVDRHGEVVSKIKTNHTKIAALDTDEDSQFLYALSDNSDVIMIIDKKSATVTKEMPTPESGQWEALDVHEGLIRIAKDDETQESDK